MTPIKKQPSASVNPVINQGLRALVTWLSIKDLVTVL